MYTVAQKYIDLCLPFCLSIFAGVKHKACVGTYGALPGYDWKAGFWEKQD